MTDTIVRDKTRQGEETWRPDREGEIVCSHLETQKYPATSCKTKESGVDNLSCQNIYQPNK